MRNKNRILTVLYFALLVCFLVISVFGIEINKLTKENNQLRQKNIKLEKQFKQEQIKISELQNKVDNQIKELNKKRVLTSKDIDSLERIVEAEAGNQGMQGKRLVASVVLNRWFNSKDKSIDDIVSAPGQFQPVANGKYYSVIPTEETKEAVNMATYKDYSNGATHFMNPTISSRGSVNWFRNNLTMTLKHEAHEFYKK